MNNQKTNKQEKKFKKKPIKQTNGPTKDKKRN